MFGSSKRLIKYDIDKDEITPEFFVLGSDTDYGIEKDFLSEGTSSTALAFYGGVLRINPLDGKLYAIVKRDGWGESGCYNWLFIIDENGKVERTIPIGNDDESDVAPKDQKYYWFPSMPLFNDHYDPEILLEEVKLLKNESATIELDDLVYDPDNMACLIKTTIESDEKIDFFEQSIENNQLILTDIKSGEGELKISTVSNGVRVEKTIPISVE